MTINETLFAFVAAGLIASPSSWAALAGKTNGEWVTATGKVTSVAPRSFDLKMKNDSIKVEMDDYGWGADGYKLVVGDQVVVQERIDKDFLEKKKIEAGSVYVKGLDTYFYANSADEEGPISFSPSYFALSTLPDGASVDAIGKVTKVDGRNFTVDTGWRKIDVTTKDMAINPTDKLGFVQIKQGDIVRVSGTLTDDFWSGKKLAAQYIVEYTK